MAKRDHGLAVRLVAIAALGLLLAAVVAVGLTQYSASVRRTLLRPLPSLPPTELPPQPARPIAPGKPGVKVNLTEEECLLGRVRSMSEEIVKARRGLMDGPNEIAHVVVLTCEYRPDGGKTAETHYDDRGALDYKWTFEYDSRGHPRKGVCYDSDGSVTYTSRLTCDKRGRVVRFTDRTPDGKYNGGAKYKYDASGNTVEEVSYNAKGRVTDRHVYKRDEKGNLVEDVYADYDDSYRSYKRAYSYYDFGLISQKREYFGGTDFPLGSVYRYEFDAAGNWTRRTEYGPGPRGFDLEETRARKITYYP